MLEVFFAYVENIKKGAPIFVSSVAKNTPRNIFFSQITNCGKPLHAPGGRCAAHDLYQTKLRWRHNATPIFNTGTYTLAGRSAPPCVAQEWGGYSSVSLCASRSTSSLTMFVSTTTSDKSPWWGRRGR